MKYDLTKQLEDLAKGAVPKVVIRDKKGALNQEEETYMNTIALEMRKLQGMRIEQMLVSPEGHHKTVCNSKAELTYTNKVRFYLLCRIKQMPTTMNGARHVLALIYNTEDHQLLNVVSSIHRGIKKCLD